MHYFCHNLVAAWVTEACKFLSVRSFMYLHPLEREGGGGAAGVGVEGGLNPTKYLLQYAINSVYLDLTRGWYSEFCLLHGLGLFWGDLEFRILLFFFGWEKKCLFF